MERTLSTNTPTATWKFPLLWKMSNPGQVIAGLLRQRQRAFNSKRKALAWKCGNKIIFPGATGRGPIADGFRLVGRILTMRLIGPCNALPFVLALLMQHTALGLNSRAESAGAGKAAPESMTNEPSAIFAQASKVHRLNSPDIQPWHIKASYATFDDQGAPRDKGIYEEFWAGAKKYKPASPAQVLPTPTI